MKNILIVGASSGIGKTVAELASKQDYQIYTASRQACEVEGVKHHTLDVTDENVDLDFLPDTLDGLVYCPGTINLKPFHRLKMSDFEQDLSINTLGAIKVLQASYSRLKKAEGSSVVLYSTVAVKLGMNFHASIATAKAALEGLGKSLASEWSANNIRVNMIAPSLTNTPLADRILSTDDRKEASNKRHPLGRYGQPEDLAEMTLFLLSDKSSWMTGQTLGVDGGMGTLKP